ncbi:hypothetical protein A2W57_00120 [Candidatus Giovannonibacteria bacterium RIFCSPHIGHO2_02_43_16]|uniref:Uncharacterized protein n=3 Tax=Candidatus Giovannoniibacteriota TaxID=1752738 RepID=A0A1F5WCT7_9BACT|nr:MAG: hypothetical protein UX06_C0018G0009 [Candidatus Giovannonibacteria bacterium GW2011_GWA2_45_21]OGF73424.1 MAG: hypothetical protein A2W57_00120 [Candidatus Giovannonibacteria bacterium RIFCSPHIGHO2_02_43_16]
MKSIFCFLIILLGFLSISPPVVFAQACQSPFIGCNGLCTLPAECNTGGNTNQPGGGNTNQPSGGSAITNPIQSNTFGELMAKIADAAAKIGLPLVAVFMIYAGFLFVSARGNEEQLTKAKTTFFWTIIGALLVVGAFAISLAIKDFAQKL